VKDIGVRYPLRTRSARRNTLMQALIGSTALAALAACSSSGGTSTSQASTGAATSSSNGGVVAAYVSQSQQLLNTAAKAAVTGPSVGTAPLGEIVPWSASAMPAPSALATGKTIRVDVVYTYPVGSPPYLAHLIQAIGAKLNWKIKVFQAASPTQQGALTVMQQAILDKPNAIIAAVVPAPYVMQALQQAKAEGIYTVAIHADEPSDPGYDAYVPEGEGIQKEILGAWIVANSGGKGKTLLVSAPGFADADVPAAAQFLQGCSGCSSKTVQFNPNVFLDPTAEQSNIAATLTANPGTQYLLWAEGAVPLQGALNAIQQSADKTVQLVMNTAAPQSIQLLKAGQVPMVVHSPEAMLAVLALDQVNRLVQGQKALAGDAFRLPITYWTKDNAPDPTYSAITAAQLKENDWLAPYEKAWGVSLKDAILSVNS